MNCVARRIWIRLDEIDEEEFYVTIGGDEAGRDLADFEVFAWLGYAKLGIETKYKELNEQEIEYRFEETEEGSEILVQILYMSDDCLMIQSKQNVVTNLDIIELAIEELRDRICLN